MSFPDDRWIALFGPTLCGVTKGCIPTPCVCANNLNPAFREVQCRFSAHTNALVCKIFSTINCAGLHQYDVTRLKRVANPLELCLNFRRAYNMASGHFRKIELHSRREE